MMLQRTETSLTPFEDTQSVCCVAAWIVRAARRTKKVSNMSRPENVTDEATSAATDGIYAGAHAMKEGFEKTAKMFEGAVEFSKANLDAYIQSVTIAGEGFKTISTEISLYSKKVIEEATAATKAIMQTKSVHEAMEIQSSFAKMAFAAYLGQIKLLNELIVGSMKDSLEPLKDRIVAMKETSNGVHVD
jgi:phasin family protein